MPGMLPQHPPKSYMSSNNNSRQPINQNQDIFTPLPPRISNRQMTVDTNIDNLGAAPSYRSEDSPNPPLNFTSRPRSQTVGTKPTHQQTVVTRQRSYTIDEGGISPSTPTTPASTLSSMFNKIHDYSKGFTNTHNRPLSPIEQEPDSIDTLEAGTKSQSRRKTFKRADSEPNVLAQRPPMYRSVSDIKKQGEGNPSDESNDDDDDDEEKNFKEKVFNVTTVADAIARKHYCCKCYNCYNCYTCYSSF